MNWIKSHWKPLAVILALLLWAAWYSRPVDIYTVAPGTKEPDMMDLNLSDLGENRKNYPIKNLTPGRPGVGPGPGGGGSPAVPPSAVESDSPIHPGPPRHRARHPRRGPPRHVFLRQAAKGLRSGTVFH